LGDDLRRDRLDISGVGEIGIGHDRRRVRVHQDDPVALFLEPLAGLRAGIVELTGLADDDRARADDQDRFDVGSLRHFYRFTSWHSQLSYSHPNSPVHFCICAAWRAKLDASTAVSVSRMTPSDLAVGLVREPACAAAVPSGVKFPP